MYLSWVSGGASSWGLVPLVDIWKHIFNYLSLKLVFSSYNQTLKNDFYATLQNCSSTVSGKILVECVCNKQLIFVDVDNAKYMDLVDWSHKKSFVESKF